MTGMLPPSRATGAWTLLGASVTGAHHAHSGRGCQDAHWHGVLPTGEALIIVSDGAGSASRADEGSQLAVLAAASALVTELMTQAPLNEAAWREVLEGAFHAVERAIRAQANATRIALREFSATLAVLILSDAWTVCGLVGDCAAVVRRADGTLQSLCTPQRGEYANTTNFATHPNASEWLDVAVLPEPVECAAVFSDGLLEMSMNVEHNRPFAPFFDPLFSFIGAVANTSEEGSAIEHGDAQRQIESFLNSERVNARTGDDKTLVLAQRRAGASVLQASAERAPGAAAEERADATPAPSGSDDGSLHQES